MSQILAHLWGDYLLQSDWMAQNKTKRFWPAWCHAVVYTACFLPIFLTRHSSFVCWAVILGTHFLIDRYRLARYVVWAKNWLGPRTAVYYADGVFYKWEPPTPPIRECPTGYPPTAPIWLSTWLLIIADNTLHLTINYLALRYL